MEDYLDLFDLAAHQIQSVLQSDAGKERGKRNNIIIGRANAAPEQPRSSTWAALRAEAPEGDFVTGSQHTAPDVAFPWCSWKLLAFFPWRVVPCFVKKL